MADRQAALDTLLQDTHAPSSLHAMEAKLRTIGRALLSWGLAPFPPTLETIHALGATLKRGGYRSAASYLWLYKGEAQRRGHTWLDIHHRAVKDAIRSCERGLGPPTRAMPLPFMALGRLPGGHDPWAPSGPIGPRNAIIAGSWWMLREAELSTLRACHVELVGDWARAGLVVRLTLPTSKNDSAAFGMTRSHRCHCTTDALPMCPAHAIVDQLLLVARRFPSQFVEGRPTLDFPLFPDAQGGVVQKEAMTATIVTAARLLHVVDTPDGTFRVSGHSLRCTGAQGLIALGWRADAVKLQGRWESETVLRYTREAALHAPTELAALILVLSGLARPPEAAPASEEPEPDIPSSADWVQNIRSQPGMFHLASATPGKARCGWRYAQTGAQVPDPPPWHGLCCKQCAPLLYAKLKADARLPADGAAGHPP